MSTKHWIRLHDFFGSASLDVIHNGERHTFQKDSIYGIRDGDGKDFRFVSREEYQILESKVVTIYEKLVTATSTTGKGIQTVKTVYFSLRPDTERLSLTVANLKKPCPTIIHSTTCSARISTKTQPPMTQSTRRLK